MVEDHFRGVEKSGSLKSPYRGALMVRNGVCSGVMARPVALQGVCARANDAWGKMKGPVSLSYSLGSNG